MAVAASRKPLRCVAVCMLASHGERTPASLFGSLWGALCVVLGALRELCELCVALCCACMLMDMDVLCPQHTTRRAVGLRMRAHLTW